jgi:hypothetical protein
MSRLTSPYGRTGLPWVTGWPAYQDAPLLQVSA